MKKCIEVPSALNINKLLYKDREMPSHVRREQRIVWNLLAHLLAAGWSSMKVDDGDEQTRVHSSKGAMELLFNLDDAYLVLRNAKGDQHWVRFVFGNDVDVISDWSFTEGDPDGFNAAMDKFDVEVYA